MHCGICEKGLLEWCILNELSYGGALIQTNSTCEADAIIGKHNMQP